MPEHEAFDDKRQQMQWPLTVIAICCVLLIFWLRVEGVIISILIAAVVMILLRFRPNSSEASTLRSSIVLSAEDIQDVLDAYEHFTNSPDPDVLADRTLYRSALLDTDTEDDAIEHFHYLRQNSARFMHRLDARINQDLSIPQLERLLAITDQRALELQEAWIAARKAARRLAP